MTASPAALAAAREEAKAIVRDRLHEIRVALGEVEDHDPRHAKPQEENR